MNRSGADEPCGSEALTPACWTAHLVGLQRITGSVGERRGSFVAEARADHTGKSSHGSWSIVEGSGTADLGGIKGTGSFDAPGGPNATYELDYELA